MFVKQLNLIYKIKQEIHVCVAYSRPNSWTEWTEIFCGHSWVAGGVIGKKIGCFSLKVYFFKIFFFPHEQRRALQLVSYIFAI